MENRKPLIVPIVLALLLPGAAFAYDINVHQGLTTETIKAYEVWKGDVLTNADTQDIVQGSGDEDDGTRPLNHFFDPVNNRGLTEGGIALGEASKVWSLDTESQGNYCNYICFGHTIGSTDKYFSSPTDYSWDRAVYEYVHGDKNRALAGLGHILHLIQDATVPAHVRNDQHLHRGVYGDPDPYETYTSQFSVAPEPARITVPRHSTLGAYFDAVAGYTNGHFVSKDTLFARFALPSLDRLTIANGFAVDAGDGHKVARVNTRFTSQNGTIVKILETELDDNSDTVLSSNWHTLSRVAVENGAGVIDLFFRAVDAEKKSGYLLAKNMSAQEREAKALAFNHTPTVNYFFGNNMSDEDRADLLGTQTAAAAAALAEETPVPLALAEEAPVAVDILQTDAEQTQVPPTPAHVLVSDPTQVPTPFPSSALGQAPSTSLGQATPSNASEQAIPTQVLVPITPGYGGGGGSAPNAQSAASSDSAGSQTTEAASTEDIATTTEETATTTEEVASSTPRTIADVYGTAHPVMINEVGWGGTYAHAGYQYIELANLTSATIPLDEFRITSRTSSLNIPLTGLSLLSRAAATNYQNHLLLQNESIGLPYPNATTSAFSLAASGEELILQVKIDDTWHDVDATPAVATCNGWCAGSARAAVSRTVNTSLPTGAFTRYLPTSMERTASHVVSLGSAAPVYTDGTPSSSWHSNDGYLRYGGLTGDRTVIFGTPGTQNSEGKPSMGFACGGETVSVTNGVHYTPPTNQCTFYAMGIYRDAARVMRLYAGTTGSSTALSADTHGTVPGIETTYGYDFTGAHQGDPYVAAIFETRNAGDTSAFDDYFRYGSSTSPHDNWWAVQWTYGP